MKRHEFLYLLLEPFLPALYGKARRDLRNELRRHRDDGVLELLDIGGRKSPYTIDLSVNVTVVELPRESDLQEKLNLGLSEMMLSQIKRTRSNIKSIVLEDMTKSTLPSNSFDIAVAVEVIEHVPQDEEFVRQIFRVLKPGGLLYITTPNGDYIKNEPPNFNPDHVRHYTRAQLASLLQKYFDDVHVTYGVKTGKYRYKGLRSLRPLRLETFQVMISNVISHLESRGLEEQPRRTAHLFATSRKGTRCNGN